LRGWGAGGRIYLTAPKTVHQIIKRKSGQNLEGRVKKKVTAFRSHIKRKAGGRVAEITLGFSKVRKKKKRLC